MRIKGFTSESPFPAYGKDSNILRLQYRDASHTPENKRPGEVESIFTARFDRNVNAGWLTVAFEEITTSRESGRVQGRTISTTLDREAAIRLARFILDNA